MAKRRGGGSARGSPEDSQQCVVPEHGSLLRPRCHESAYSTAVPEVSLEWSADPVMWMGTSELRAEKLLGMPISQDIVRQRVLYMRDVPWRMIAAHVFSTVCANPGTDIVCRVRHSCLHVIACLKLYLEHWRSGSPVVEYVLAWRMYTNPTEMCEASRPAAWLADVVYTVMLVGLGFARPTVKYIPVGNYAYVQLADNLGVEGDRNNSADNLGNMFEFITWVAFE